MSEATKPDELRCGHCEALFSATKSQRGAVKYRGAAAYCSAACRIAKQQERGLAARFIRGPCPTCKKTFHSNRRAIFCGMDCYTASDQFKAHGRKMQALSQTPESIAKRAAMARKYEPVPCLSCGIAIYPKKGGRGQKKYCSKVCYRTYMAGRFDRWIASPQGLALPQCYDEFLDAEELPCLIEGCGWVGRHLSVHVNAAHGLTAAEFKRAAGFNLNSGIVGRGLAQRMSEAAHNGTNMELARAAQALATPVARRVRKYKSLEGVEHRKKARALICEELGPERQCDGCGEPFRQSTPMGRAMFCTRACRSEAYRQRAAAKAKTPVRQSDGTFRWVER